MRGEKYLKNEYYETTSKMRTKQYFKKQEFLQKDIKKFRDRKKDRQNEYFN